MGNWPESFEKKMLSMFNEILGRPDEFEMVEVIYAKGPLKNGFGEYKCKVIFRVAVNGMRCFMYMPQEDPWKIPYNDLYKACLYLVKMIMRREPELTKNWKVAS